MTLYLFFDCFYLIDNSFLVYMHNVPYVSIQLVFASGSVSLGLLDEMLLPRYALSGAPIYLRVYMRTFRPILVALVKVSN